MLTKNFFSLAKLGTAAVRYSTNTAFQIADAVITNTSGVGNNGWGWFTTGSGGTNTSLGWALLNGFSSGIKLAAGTSSAAFDENMYTLENMKLSPAIIRTNFGVDADGRLTISGTITNDGTSDFVIAEVGYVPQLRIQNESGNQTWDVLIARQLLDAPVTLAAGESATVTMVVDW